MSSPERVGSLSITSIQVEAEQPLRMFRALQPHTRSGHVRSL